MKTTHLKWVLTALLSLNTIIASAQRFPIPQENTTLIGKVTSHQVVKNETIASIARHYDLGYFELLEANPHVNPKNLTPGTELIVPSQFMLPNVPHTGIIINLGTMRLYYFPKNKDYFYTYPVGIGKQNWSTPLGQLSIIQKIPNPIWEVPQSIYEYRLQQGDPVPKKVLPGPDNPLGEFALRLSKPTYLIHGTNEPDSVGVRSSAGCIHLYPEDIEELFNNIEVGEKVLIINQPYQANWNQNKLYLQAYLPLAEERQKLEDIPSVTTTVISDVARNEMRVNWGSAEQVVRDHTGIPIVVGETK